MYVSMKLPVRAVHFASKGQGCPQVSLVPRLVPPEPSEPSHDKVTEVRDRRWSPLEDASCPHLHPEVRGSPGCRDPAASPHRLDGAGAAAPGAPSLLRRTAATNAKYRWGGGQDKPTPAMSLHCRTYIYRRASSGRSVNFSAGLRDPAQPSSAQPAPAAATGGEPGGCSRRQTFHLVGLGRKRFVLPLTSPARLQRQP